MDYLQDKTVVNFLNTLSELAFLLDSSGKIIAFHSLEPQLAFLAEKASQKQPLEEVFTAQVAQAFRLAQAALTKTSLRQRVTFQLVTPNGPRFYAARMNHPSVDEKDVFLVVAWDVTEHALSQFSRLESEEFYRLQVENSSDVISVHTFSGEYIYVSPSVKRLIGFDPDELQGKQSSDLWHPEDLAHTLSSSPQGLLVPTEKGARVRHRLQHKQGHWVWVESLARLIKWRGQPSVLCTTRDFTLQQQAEDKASMMMLELADARGKAEAASSAKSKFLADLNHELRTPLHGILGMADLLEQTHQTEEQREYLTVIKQSGELLLALLNDLQDLSRIEAGTLSFQENAFDLVETVESLSDLLGNLASTKEVELHCHVKSQVPSVVWGCGHRIRQVLLNLLSHLVQTSTSNRIEALVTSGEGDRVRFVLLENGMLEQAVLDPTGDAAPLSLTIAHKLIHLMGGTFETDLVPEQGRRYSFTLHLPASSLPAVKDGLLRGRRVLATEANASIRQRLRDILEQAGAEVEVASGGVEVIRTLRDNPHFDAVLLDLAMNDLDGLSTAAIIRGNTALAALPLLMQGTADRINQAKQNTELMINGWLCKPLRQETLVRAVQAAVNHEVFIEETTPTKGTTILIVEDNDVNMCLAREILHQVGYEVIGARSGKEALSVLSKQSVDAVLMDIQLPDMDGLEATAKIRNNPAWSNIPIIAVTAQAMKGDAERVLKAGLDNYLSKPVNRHDLLTVISQAVDCRGKTRASAASILPP